MEKKQTMALVIVLSNLFLAFLGISLVIPVVPTIMDELHLSGSVVGYLVAAFAFFTAAGFADCRKMGGPFWQEKNDCDWISHLCFF
ncbi:hypothetical protein RWE15_16860 [Virgibacillus halophilus]|uniref:Major facilitator superfamily (MFS) profile domain-containing protein n=1 Tax=Tigheibacillus halophilus TaxID=361280 RepID=A0ABU5C8W4_9BACI|nr:hypothetical protein [Virgibacillus halophilus]